MTDSTAKPHRDTIFLDDARVVSQQEFPGNQYILRVAAPETAKHAIPGSFAHIRCDADIPMRRPLSIMRADAKTGEVDFLYKIVGNGLRALSHARAGEAISILGPIGNGFSTDPARPRKLMLGGGVGIPPMLFLAEHLHATGIGLSGSLVVMGSEVPFPFEPCTSKLNVAGVASDVTNGMPDLENINVPSRLASMQNYAGCHNGYVTDIATNWLLAIGEDEVDQVEMFACGPEPMLEAAAKVAARFNIPCQLCLEEFMACAVGGCAGCAVPVYTAQGMAMKRVCVDGPVFEARSIYPA